MSVERDRLISDPESWRTWGPYLAERAWGTVREDYSADGDAWSYFPFEASRTRAYRWSEDGLGGICDLRQYICFAFSFWNGRDPILKERIFGLSNHQGNHGEDAKEYWFYLDATPTHSWLVWRYLYPQEAFPYEELVEESACRDRTQPEFELADTGVLDKGFWEITVSYAKAGPEEILIDLKAVNMGPAEAELHALANLWFRNTWSWGDPNPKPQLGLEHGAICASHPHLGRLFLVGSDNPLACFCDNETDTAATFGTEPLTPYPKSGISDHVVRGAETVNPNCTGTKAAFVYRLKAQAGDSKRVRLRLGRDANPLPPDFDEVIEARRREADEFYSELIPPGTPEAQASVARQAFAGMIWSKQFYHFDLERWRRGDPTQPPPPKERAEGRNKGWRHLDNRDVISMPDKWEYPWYAAWDLAFHCVVIARLDPAYAKHQLSLILREWYMHPNGQLPAYEWDFSDVNPPVHAWATLKVFELAADGDFEFLEQVFSKLLINFTWWVNRKDALGNNVFEGGFLGLDNIGPIDRSSPLPVPGVLEQTDGTAWMAMYCLDMLRIALVLARHDRTWEQMAVKFFEHCCYIAAALYEQGLWNEEDGFYYDVLKGPDGGTLPLRVRSIVGLIPLCATAVLEETDLENLDWFRRRFQWFVENKPAYASHLVQELPGRDGKILLSVVDRPRLVRLLDRMFSEDEFLSPYGLRSLSLYHQDNPVIVELGGYRGQVDYEPAESTTPMFGGNSNWRGPVWMPLNYLLAEALARFSTYFGDEPLAPDPHQSGKRISLSQAAAEIERRVTSLFLPNAAGERPCYSNSAFLQDYAGRQVLFYEYFNPETGAGLGASHQTGWTALVADMICRRWAVANH
jgi:hypothetical protein